jgi:hypothetical protein
VEGGAGRGKVKMWLTVSSLREKDYNKVAEIYPCVPHFAILCSLFLQSVVYFPVS